MQGVFSAEAAVLAKLYPVWVVLFILRGRVVSLLAVVARERNFHTHAHPSFLIRWG
jgi:hypothetical protein